jgi:hypothetical protein
VLNGIFLLQAIRNISSYFFACFQKFCRNNEAEFLDSAPLLRYKGDVVRLRVQELVLERSRQPFAQRVGCTDKVRIVTAITVTAITIYAKLFLTAEVHAVGYFRQER